MIIIDKIDRIRIRCVKKFKLREPYVCAREYYYYYYYYRFVISAGVRSFTHFFEMNE